MKNTMGSANMRMTGGAARSAKDRSCHLAKGDSQGRINAIFRRSPMGMWSISACVRREVSPVDFRSASAFFLRSTGARVCAQEVSRRSRDLGGVERTSGITNVPRNTTPVRANRTQSEF